MKRLTGYFLQGVLFMAPISVTAYVIYLVFDVTDSLLQQVLSNVIGREIPGLGIVIMTVFLTILGYVGQTIIARPFRLLFNRIMHSIPPLELVYTAIKDFFSAFVGKDKKFNKPVTFKLNPDDNAHRVGFITNQQIDAFGDTNLVAVYVPFSYTFTGETYLVDRKSIKEIDLPPAEVMKFLVAGGVAEVNGLQGKLEV